MPTAGEMKALRKRVADAFSYAPLKVVNYSYDGVRINYADFKKVAVAVSKGNVRVAVGQLPVGAGAMYLVSGEQADTIVVPNSRYGSSVAEKILLAHEAVHCILDAKGVSISALWTEVCAYITTGILEMYAAIPAGGHGDTLTNELFAAARKVAGLVVDQKRNDLDSSMPEIIELQATVLNHPNYRSTVSNPDFSWGEDGVKGM